MNFLRRWMTIAGMILAMTVPLSAASYTVTAAPGWNLFVNQLDASNGNNIRNVLLKPPLGSVVRKFSLTTGTFDPTETYQQLLTGAQAWSPGTSVLNPGEGFYFWNPSARAITLTFNGELHTPKLPIKPPGSLILVGRQNNDTAKLEDILGFTPTTSTIVYRFVTGTGHDPDAFLAANYTTFALKGGAWINPPGAPPAFNVGESVWISTAATLPTIDRQPAAVTVCPGSKAGFTVGASGSPPLSYQWFLEGKPIPNATGVSYSISPVSATDAGTYTVQVTNPLGTTTSTAVKLTMGDTTPPVLTCPANIVTSCRGLGGTQVTFDIRATDNCDSAPVVTAVPPSGSAFPGGVTTVQVTAKDASGNTSTCSFTVTVIDDIRPQIVCPQNIAVTATNEKGGRAFFDVTAVDNCDTAPKVECVPPSGSVFPVGDTLVTCTATDANGNSSICRFTVTVLDAACCKDKAWSIADVTGPEARFGHMMAYDSLRSRVVLFGGETQKGVQADTWEWDGIAWSRIATEGPNARSHGAMSFDSKIGRVVMHGGRSPTAGALDDTWLYDGSKWQLVTQKSVGNRFNHAMAYDSVRRVTVLHGGTPGDAVDLDDTWEFDGKAWAKVFAGSGGPAGRQGHSMSYGSAQRQLLLFGGEFKGQASGETWQWDGKTWKQLAKSGPAPRTFASMAYSDNCDAVVLFGGGTNNVYGFGDTWEWDGKTWTQTSSGKLSPRGRAAMAHDSAHNQTVLCGGTRTLKDWAGETWLLGLSKTAPQVVSVDAVCGEKTLIVAFDHPVSASSAQLVSNYLIDCGQTQNAVVRADLSDDPRIVVLSLASAINGGCRVTIQGVRDACGRVMITFQTSVECRTDPCVRGSAGLDFWLTFPGNYNLDPTNQPVPQLYVAGTAGTIGTVAIPGLASPFSSPFVIPANGVVQVVLPREADLADSSDAVQSNAVHVVASRPVAVYGLNHVPYSTDGYLGLSTRALGQTYLVMAYGNLFTDAPELNGSQFAIAATADNTTATIVPSTSVGGRAAGVPYLVTLMRGQTYQLRSTNGFPSDLTGTLITSDQPIAVFGGHRSSTVPDTNVFFADHLVEQIPPTDTWGTNFLTLPFATRSNGDTFRAMALIDGTTVKTNGVAIPGSVNRGRFVEFTLVAGSQVTSDKPILLAQYARSSDFDGVLNADPFVVVVPPVAFYSPNYVIPAPSTNFASNHLNLIVPKAAVNAVVLDGAAVASTLFTPIGGSDYFGARVPVVPGPHQVTAGGNAFGVVAYGWSLYNAYGYPGQTCGRTLSRTVDIKCPTSELVLKTGPDCKAILPDLGKQIAGSSDVALVKQEPAPGTPLVAGNYTVVLSIVDVFGQVHTCRVFVNVTFGTAAGLQCPGDLVTNCTSTAGQFVVFDASVCNPAFKVTAEPPSGSFFPVGTTKVVVSATGANGVVERCTFTVTVGCPGLVTIQQNAGLPVIDWSGIAVFQRAPTPNGPWVTVPDAKPPFTIQPSKSAEFFRVLQ